MIREEIVKFIDYIFLRFFVIFVEIKKFCDEVLKYFFVFVCVNFYYVKLCKEYLKELNVKVVIVIGFLFGVNIFKIKVFEVKEVFENGVDEIDMVINIGVMLSGDIDYVYEEIKSIVDVVREYLNKIVKVIIEIFEFDDDKKVEVCKIVVVVGVDFVKIFMGFFKSGVKYEDIFFMRKVVGSKVKIKVLGGIRMFEDVFLMI